MCRMIESRFTNLSPEEITEVADSLEQYLDYAYNLGASSCDDEVDRLEDENNEYENTVNDLEREIKNLNFTIKDFEKEVESLNAELTDYKEELKEVVASLNEAQNLLEEQEK